jgi:hypothetical protein
LTTDNKRILGSIILFLSSFIYFFLAYVGFKKQNINLTDYEKLTSKVIDKGIDYRHGSKGRLSKCFFVYLDNLRNQKLGVYRSNEKYADLEKSILIGDSVKVYFIDRPDNGERINIDLIQIEKRNKVIFDKKEYEARESSLIYIGLIAGTFSVLFSILYYKKVFYKEKI